MRRPWIVVGALLLLTWLAYLPGLSGGFLFDDFVNLDALGRYGPVDSWSAFARYVTSGTADPTGRPLAMASFLLDARNWPAAPGPFLRTNLLFHLLNGCLLFNLLRQLEAWWTPGNPNRRDLVALFAVAVWLLHPLLVSTTLYVVQREALLSTAFVLGGLGLYLAGVRKFIESRGVRGSGCMIAGVVGGTLLGTLCKANGALLPLLGLVLVATALPINHAFAPSAGAGWSNTWRRLTGCLLVLPSVVLLLYVLSFVAQWDHSASGRPWTIGQRLLTEPRVIVDYLRLLLMPRAVSGGVYQDGIRASASLMDPPTTLWSLVGIFTMLAVAIGGRRRWPRFSAAILFFLAAHSIESSAIPLELSFEHRNYLPSALLAWPAAAAVTAWRRPAWQRALVMAMVVVLLATITWQRTSLWGNPTALAATWALRNPESARAQAAWALDSQQTANPAAVLARLRPLWEEDPGNVQIAVNAFDAACRSKRLDPSDMRLLGQTARTAPGDYDLLRQWLADRIIDDGDCLSMRDIHGLLVAAASNPGFNSPAGGARNLMPLQAALALHEHQPDVALAYFNRSFLADPRPETAFNQAALMAAQGAYAGALAHIDFYERHHASLAEPRAGMPWLHVRVLAWQHYWPAQFAMLRRGIESALRANGARHPRGVPSS